MRKFICSVCGYIYDESNGTFKDLPNDWVCPICGATKEAFEIQGESIVIDKKLNSTIEEVSDIKEMSSLEASALCTNLARGCEKQYKPEEANLFSDLGSYFKGVTPTAENPDFSRLLDLIEENLNEDIPNAIAVASDNKDRGAMRALVWNEKVTRILKSLLLRYQKQGNSMLVNTGIYVCTICGFIYIGDKLPELCPVCKVPNWKFEKIEGGKANV